MLHIFALLDFLLKWHSYQILLTSHGPRLKLAQCLSELRQIDLAICADFGFEYQPENTFHVRLYCRFRELLERLQLIWHWLFSMLHVLGRHNNNDCQNCKRSQYRTALIPRPHFDLDATSGREIVGFTPVPLHNLFNGRDRIATSPRTSASGFP